MRETNAKLHIEIHPSVLERPSTLFRQGVHLQPQRISLRGHDEVVPVESPDLVGPPGHRDAPPLGEEGGMVTLCLGESSDLVGEGQRVGEAREVEYALELGMRSRSRSCQSGTSRLNSALSASVTRGESWRQATHRSADSVLIAAPPSCCLRAGYARRMRSSGTSTRL